MDPSIIWKYFPSLDDEKRSKLELLGPNYASWNEKINLISRKDIDELYVRHVLHSLSIAKFISFERGSKILDVGTGGGFPGIPLAILFPECQFLLVDSIGKKIEVVRDISMTLGLTNIEAQITRAENIQEKFDFVVSRAVARSKVLLKWVGSNLLDENRNNIKNGLILLKGGDLGEELAETKREYQQLEISMFFRESFFETKKIIYIPR